MRRSIALCALALGLVHCGGDDPDPTIAPDATSDSEGSDSTAPDSDGDSGGTDSSAPEDTLAVDGAPDVSPDVSADAADGASDASDAPIEVGDSGLADGAADTAADTTADSAADSTADSADSAVDATDASTDAAPDAADGSADTATDTADAGPTVATWRPLDGPLPGSFSVTHNGKGDAFAFEPKYGWLFRRKSGVTRWELVGRGIDSRDDTSNYGSALAIGPSDQIYVTRPTSDALYRSSDDGATFTATYTSTDRPGGVAVTASGAVLLAMKTGLYKLTDELRRSTDGGVTFTVVAGVAAPRVRASGSTVIVYGTEDAPKRSTDDGVTFAPVTGLPAGTVRDLALQGSNAYAIVQASDGFKLARSTDGGATFSVVGPAMATAVGFDGGTPSRVFVMTPGFQRSTDSGATFSPVALATPYNQPVNVATTSSRTLLGLLTFGVSASTDGGASFTPMNEGLHGIPTDEVVVRMVGGSASGDLLARSVATGGTGIWTRSTSAGATWNVEEQLYGAVASPTHDLLLGVAGFMGGTLSSSTNGGATWTEITDVPSGTYVLGFDRAGNAYLGGADGTRRAPAGTTTWTLSTTVKNPYQPIFGATAILVRSGGLSAYRSTDGGVTWTSHGGYYANHHAALDSGTILTAYHSGAASSTSTLTRSTDGGATFTDLTTLTGKRVTAMTAIGNTVYVAYYEHAAVPWSPRRYRVVRSNDAGNTWTDVSDGLWDAEVKHLTRDRVGGLLASTTVGLWRFAP